MSAPILNMAGRSGDARPANRVSATDADYRFDPSSTAPASAGALLGFTVTLPLPPSTNNLFKAAGRGRAKSREYTLWLEAAGWALKQERLLPVTGRYALLLALPRGMPGDCSNRLKAPEDLLVAHGLTPDDRHNDLVMAYRSDAVSGAACILTVVPIHQVSAALASVGGGPRPLPVTLPQGEAEAA